MKRLFSLVFCIIKITSNTLTINNNKHIITSETGVVFNLPISILSDLLFKLLQPPGIFFNLSISNLSTSNFKLAKSAFLAKSDLSVSASASF